jgi:hypothetical protein
MKRLILILNGKGGVGKSFFAVNFVQFLKDKGIAHVAIDSDNENSTLKRFHPDTRFLDLSKRRDLDGIFAALAKTNLVVVDCRAASTDLFIDFFNEIDLPAMLSAFDAKLTLVMPVNHESDSVDQIQRLTDEFKNRCNYVVVRNAAHSDSFAIFESSEVRALLADKLGGREITMTRMQDWLVEALNAENLTITAAQNILRSACWTGNDSKPGSGNFSLKSNLPPTCFCLQSDVQAHHTAAGLRRGIHQGRCRVAR